MKTKQPCLSKTSTSRFTTTATLGVAAWLLLSFLPVRHANGQGTVVFNNRIEVTIPQSITHVWGPAQDYPELSLIGHGTNDIPSGTVPFSGYGMILIGTGGREGHFGWDTTFAQLLGAVGVNQPESTLVPVGQTTTFRGDALGNLVEITNRLIAVWPHTNVIPKDAAAATFEIVVWDNSSGLYPTWVEACPAWLNGLITAGHSAPFTTTAIGGDINPTPYLNNGQGTSWVMSFNLYLLFGPVDIGLRACDGNGVVRIGCEPPEQVGALPSSPLRIAKNGTNCNIRLVKTNDWRASKIQIQTASGIKALMKLP